MGGKTSLDRYGINYLNVSPPLTIHSVSGVEIPIHVYTNNWQLEAFSPTGSELEYGDDTDEKDAAAEYEYRGMKCGSNST